MQIQIKTFGMITEALETELLILDNFKGETLTQLKATLLNEHPILNGLSFSLAYDNAIISESELLKFDKEVALLPPFGGG